MLILTAGARVGTGKRVTYQQKSGDQAFQVFIIPGQPEKVARADVEMFHWIDEYGCESIERRSAMRPRIQLLMALDRLREQGSR